MRQREFAKIWQGWLDSIEQIPDEGVRAELALAIFRYALRGIKYTGDNVYINILLPTIEKSIDNSDRNAMNGQKGGLQKAANSGANSDANSGANSDANDTKTIDIDIDIDKRHKDKDYDMEADLLGRGVPANYVHDYLLVRKNKRARNTQSATELLINNAAKAGITLAYAVQLCAQYSWQSFNPKYVQGFTLDDPYKKKDVGHTPITQQLDQFGQPIVDIDLNQ